MNPLDDVLEFLFGGLRVGGPLEERLIRWKRRRDADLTLPHARARYVVVDSETSGLDLKRDRVIAIGAAAVSRGALELGDCFETVLRQDRASDVSNILIHGIGGERQRDGVDPKLAMLDFLDYLGKAPLVAFRADFDRAMIERGLKSILGLPFRHPWIDLAFLLPALFPGTECRSLDDWLVYFGIAAGERHHAVADAFATAMLLQIALVAAEREGMRTAAQLIAMQKAQAWLGKRA